MRFVLALAAAVLLAAPAARADTRVPVWISEGTGPIDVSYEGSSTDGSYVFFTTVERLHPDDGDDSIDIYVRHSGAISLLSDSQSPGHVDAEKDAEFKHVSANGWLVTFVTEEPLEGDDHNFTRDVYQRNISPGVPADRLALMSGGVVGEPGTFVGASDDGHRVYFATYAQLEPEDTDDSRDVYVRDDDQGLALITGKPLSGPDHDPSAAGASGEGGRFFWTTPEKLSVNDTDGGHYDVYRREGTEIALMSTGVTGGNGPFNAEFRNADADGSHVYFATDESLRAADTDTRQDVYERAGGVTTLVSRGEINGNGDFIAELAGFSDDGSRVFFHTEEPLVAEDTDTAQDIYERSGGVTTLVSTGPGQGISPNGFLRTTPDGSHVYFITANRLVLTDTDVSMDIYERAGGVTTLVSEGNGPFNALPAVQVTDDGSRVFFVTDDPITGDDTDAQFDSFERASGVITRLPSGNGPSSTLLRSVTPDGARAFIQTPEALVGGDGDGSVDIYAADLGASPTPTPTPTPTPSPNPLPPPSDTSKGDDKAAPAVGLSGPKTQKFLKQGAVIVFARCGEPCSLVASGTLTVPGAAKVYRLKKVRRSGAAGAKVKLALKLPRKARQPVKAALRRGLRVRARVKIVATDAAGNRRTTTRKLRAKR